MAPLKFGEKRKLEEFLGMGGGYVLSFSDRTFRASYWEIAPPLPPCSIAFSITVMYSNVVPAVGVRK
jgi:hypothetical protein